MPLTSGNGDSAEQRLLALLRDLYETHNVHAVFAACATMATYATWRVLHDPDAPVSELAIAELYNAMFAAARDPQEPGPFRHEGPLQPRRSN